MEKLVRELVSGFMFHDFDNGVPRVFKNEPALQRNGGMGPIPGSQEFHVSQLKQGSIQEIREPNSSEIGVPNGGIPFGSDPFDDPIFKSGLSVSGLVK
jgi:hypothetical protein